MSNTLNNITPYSLGIATINLPLNDDILTIYPESILPMVDGELQDGMDDYSATITDSMGNTRTISVNTSICIRAKWYCQDPNVLTPPNIRRGARVQIWREANTGYFYWSTITNTNNFQKLETKVIGFSNTKNENEKPSKENTWTQGVSTHEKKVNIIHTTKSDGEKWSYDINLDASAGIINIKDDIGNFIKIDSGNKIVHLETADRAFIKIEGRNITIDGDDVTLNCKNFNTSCSNNMSTNVGGSQSNDVSGGISTSTPGHDHKGNINLGGSMAVSGDVSSPSVSLNTHTHTEQGDGSETSGPH